MRAVVVGAVLAIALACEPVAQPTPHASVLWRQGQAIIGGTVATGDPAVVALAVGSSGGSYEQYCTGTLVGPKTVLTAAHCIDAYGPGFTYWAVLGTSVDSPTSEVRVESQVANPDYQGDTSDFGLVRLEAPVVGVTPIGLNERAIDSSWLGRSIRHVGFGVDDAVHSAGNGTKREVRYALRVVHAMEIESGATGKQTCSGDSGGPAFMTLPEGGPELVVGVVRWGDAACRLEGWDGRVDAVLPWLRQTMAAWETPTCTTDGLCVPGCTPVDQDCACAADGLCTADCADPARDPDCPLDCANNGVCAVVSCPTPDPDCVADGQRCASAAVCHGRLCLTDPQHTDAYCSRACTSSSQCSPDMECTGQVCHYIPKPSRRLYEACDAATDYCVDGLCTGPQGGITRCVHGCVSASDCTTTENCEGGASSQRYCQPPALRFTAITVPRARDYIGKPAGCATVAGMPLGWVAVALLLRRRTAGSR